MKYLFWLIFLFPCLMMGQGSITPSGSIDSVFSVAVTNITNDTAATRATAQSITNSSGTCTMIAKNRNSLNGLGWVAGNQITLTATGSNGDSIVDPLLVSTFTLLTVNNTSHTYTFSCNAAAANYAADQHDYEIPYQECDQNGHLWQIVRKANASGSYMPDTISARVSMSNAGCSGGAPTDGPWSAFTTIFQWTAVSCSTGSNGPADIRNWSFGKIVHGGITTFAIIWTPLCSDGLTFLPSYYAYLDSPDAANPAVGWSTSVSGPAGIPGTALSPMTWNSSSYTVRQTFGRMFCTKLDCSEIGTNIGHTTAGQGALIIVTSDGHSWTAKAQVPYLSLSTNEATGSLLQDNNHFLMFSREFISTAGNCVTHFCNLRYVYSTNFSNATPTFINGVANMPIDPRNTATGSQFVSPELRCHLLGASLCWLVWTERIGYSGTNQSSLKSLIFDPATFVSALTFAGTTTIQNLYDSIPIISLSGYAEPFLSSNGTDLAIWWHDYTFYSGTPVSPLNIFSLTGTLTSSLKTLTSACGGPSNGTISSGDAVISCTCTAGSSSGMCADIVGTGDSVVLTAVPSGGAAFQGFSTTGGCSTSGTNPYTVTMSADCTSTATFNPPAPNSQISGHGVISGNAKVR